MVALMALPKISGYVQDKAQNGYSGDERILTYGNNEKKYIADNPRYKPPIDSHEFMVLPESWFF
ncbi:hypothetical protein [Bifidobacterium felsineum]|uniref:hypothetical protein n=1 Tax=Bifidobacterium felsineum TaxID=2045440 RepID=UPI001BDBFF6E|nr:hypothetical protein [Bifidobacterium felsineum]